MEQARSEDRPAARDDITELKRVGRELANLAYTDDLTGLANRRRFNRVLHGRAEDAARYERAAALLMLDLDELKAINDTFGHGAGDRVIRDVAWLSGRGCGAPTSSPASAATSSR